MQQTASSKISPLATRRSKARLAWIGQVFLGILALLVLYLVVKNLVQKPTLFIQIVASGLQLGFVYAMIALGYTMVYGIVKLINFAHGDVFMAGAFTSYFAVSQFSLHEWPLAVFPGISPTLAVLIGSLTVILLAMLVCVLLAVTIERVAYKPLRDAPRIAALITAIGVSFFLEYYSALPVVFTSNYVTYVRPFEVQFWEPGGVKVSSIMVITVVTAIAALLLLQWIVSYTKMGKAMRASSYDKPTARLMGINVDGVITFTFAVGAALAGVAAVLYAIAYPQIWNFMGIWPGLKAFVAAVLGGIGSIPGAFVGGLIMGQVEVLSAAYISSPMRDAIAFTVLILVLLVRPQGIFGEPEREKA